MLRLSITQEEVEEQRQEEDREQCARVYKRESSRRWWPLIAHLLPHSSLWRFLG